MCCNAYPHANSDNILDPYSRNDDACATHVSAQSRVHELRHTLHACVAVSTRSAFAGPDLEHQLLVVPLPADVPGGRRAGLPRP